MASEDDRPSRGDWVQVWAQVTDPRPHPEEVAVRFESHNEHYVGLVRLEHVDATGAKPDFAEQCTALAQVQRTTVQGHVGHFDFPAGVLVRCDQHAGHGLGHRNDGLNTVWSDEGSYGYVEER